MIERKIYQDGSLVVTKCSGEVTAEELIKSEYWMINIFGGEIKPGFCQIFDALDADADNITENDIHRVAQVNHESWRRAWQFFDGNSGSKALSTGTG